jgi:predicted GNAT family acetyltransferase
MSNPKSLKYILKKSDDITDPTPRQKASKDTIDQLVDVSEYKYARKSKIKNQGEDIAKSARHIRGQWKGLEDSEASGTADKMVTLKNMQKFDPLDIMPTPGVHSSDSHIKRLAAQAILNKFPSQPEKVSAGSDGLRVVKKNGQNTWSSFPKSSSIPDDHEVKDYSTEDLQKMARSHYVKTYQMVKDLLQKHVEDPGVDMHKMVKDIRNQVSKHILDSRANPDPGFQRATHNHFVNFVNNGLSPTGRKKTSATHTVSDFIANTLKSKGVVDRDQIKQLIINSTGKNPNATEVPGQFTFSDELAGHLHDPIMQYLEGKPVSKIFPSGKPNTKRTFNHESLYGDSSLRSGPEMSDNHEDHESAILKDMKLRGLQYGNSVTDSERSHHVKNASMALQDLTRTLGLPKEMASFNGRLGLAIGARGKGGALAHYEPDLMTINLTRKGGTGSLAHEWAHFFDHILNKTTMDRDGFASAAMNGSWDFRKKNYKNEDHEHVTPVYQAMNEISKYFDNHLAPRMRKDYRNDEVAQKQISPEKLGNYWFSDHEMFARAFEGYLHNKMKQKGEFNHYLTKHPNHFLWLKDDEVKHLTPYFDKLFDSFKGSKYLKKSMDMISPLYHVRFGNGIRPKQETSGHTEWELSKDDLWQILENFHNHRWFEENTPPMPSDVPEDPRKSIFDLNHMNRSQAKKWLTEIYNGLGDTQKITMYTHKFPDRDLQKSDNKDQLPGGKGDKKTDKEFSKKEVAMGHKVEAEHTKNPKIAAEITKDHLSEKPNYYSKLKEAGLADELEKGINGDWKKEGYTFDWKEHPYEIEPERQAITVNAYDADKNQVGAYLFSHHPDYEILSPEGSHTELNHRRKGLAQKAYNIAEEMTGKFIQKDHGGAQSKDAKAFWSKRLQKTHEAKALGNDQLSTPHSDHLVHSNKVTDKIDHHVHETGSGTTHSLVHVDQTGKRHVLATMDIYQHSNEDRPYIAYSQVNPKFKGKGFGKVLYLQALKHHGSLRSDSHTSQNANKAWEWLGKQPNVSVKMGTPGTDESHVASYNQLNKSEVLEKRSKNVREQTRNITPEQALARRLKYAISLGLKPQSSSKDGFPEAQGNTVPYNDNFGIEHETAHAVMTPKGHTISSYQKELGPSEGDYGRDYNSTVDESTANRLESMIDRRAGVGGHASKFRVRTPLGSVLSESTVDPNEEGVPGAHTYEHEYWKQFPDDSSQEGVATLKPFTSRAKPYINKFDQGAKFNEKGEITESNNINAKINKKMNKSEDLQKGVARKIAPYSPPKGETEDSRFLSGWTTDAKQEVRNELPRHKGAIRFRALNKLAARTKTRVNKETGEREYLLHRGMGATEFDNGNFKNSSWTPKLTTAMDFASDYGIDDDSYVNLNNKVRSYVVSAWIPEKHIHNFPFMHGHDPKIKPYAPEYEVVVNPHQLQIHASGTPEEMRNHVKNKGRLITIAQSLPLEEKRQIVRKKVEGNLGKSESISVKYFNNSGTLHYIKGSKLAKSEDFMSNKDMINHLSNHSSFSNSDSDIISDYLEHNGDYILKEIPINSVHRQDSHSANDYPPSMSNGPIIINKKNIIVDGNHRHAQAERDGKTHIKAWVPVTNKLSKSEDLQKGSFQRKNPINPKQDSYRMGASQISLWQHAGWKDNSGKSGIPRMEGNLRNRALHKLSGMAESRINPKTNKRQFLLHRIMSDEEAIKTIKGKTVKAPRVLKKDQKIYSPLTSWAANMDGINAVMEDAKNKKTPEGHYKNLVSAWVDEDHIHHMPMMLGNVNKWGGWEKGPNPYHAENEVILSPKHTSLVHNIQSTQDLAQQKLNKSKDLEKGLKGDWQKEGYTLHVTPSMPLGTPKAKFDPKQHGFIVQAKDKDGKYAGSASIEHKGENIIPYGITISEQHRRKGIASGIYKHAQELSGKKIVPEYVAEGTEPAGQSKDAQALWNQPNRPFGKSLKKGVMRLKAPYNPKPGDQLESAENSWIKDGVAGARERLPEHTGPIKDRALNKIMAQTKTRKNNKGEREFLLYRGMSEDEYLDHKRGDVDNHTSWTPKLSSASMFTSGGRHKIMSAWIPESQMHHFPFMLAHDSEIKSDFRNEMEVVIKPHKVNMDSQYSMYDADKEKENKELPKKSIPDIQKERKPAEWRSTVAQKLQAQLNKKK